MKFFLLAILLFFNCSGSTKLPKIKKGILDLKSINFDLKKNGAILLQGESEFYWKRFYPENNLNLVNKSRINYIEIPSVWNKFNQGEEKISSYGYATYRFLILLPSEEKQTYSLKIRDQAHAYRLLIDGKFIKEWGKVSDNDKLMIPEMKPDLVSFQNSSEIIEVIFQVSNFHHRVGGLRYNIWFGLDENIREEQKKIITMDSFLFGGIFLISIYHFAIFFFRRKGYSALFFALFCLSVLIYVMSTGERILYYYFPEFNNWEWKYKLEFFWLSLIPTFLVLLFISLFPPKNRNIINKLIPIHLLINILFITFTFFTPPKIFTDYLIILDIDRITISLFIIFYMVVAMFEKREGSIIFFSGFLVLFLFSINDVLVARSILSTPQLTKFGLSIMILLQAIMLAKVFTNDFKSVERLTDSLSLTNTVFGKFVPTEFLSLLEKKSILEVQLGDQVQKNMTILFSDIRSFTRLSEKMSPSENFSFLNSYLSKIAPIIKENNGFIDKFIGDAIMGLFPGSPDDAVKASIKIQKTINELNLKRTQTGLEELQVGIGLHTGDLILGTIGHDERMESTVISDAVNLASRMEGLTKHYGTRILISEDTFNELEDPSLYKVRLLDNVVVKGKMNSIFVVEVLDGFPEELLNKFTKTKELFETGSLMYKQSAFEASISFFKKVLDKNPEDKACAFYLKRAEYYNIHGAPPEWEGIEEFLDK